MLLSKLRIGLAAKSVLVALVQAIVLTPPDKNFPPRILNRNVEGPIRGSALKTLLEESVEIVKEVYEKTKTEGEKVHLSFAHWRVFCRYSEVPSYETMLGVLLDVNEEYGTTISALREKCFIKAGIPVNPMLAQPTKGITEVLDRFSETGFTCE
jgi:DNA ligase-1